MVSDHIGAIASRDPSIKEGHRWGLSEDMNRYEVKSHCASPCSSYFCSKSALREKQMISTRSNQLSWMAPNCVSPGSHSQHA